MARSSARGDGAADGGVEVRCAAALRFDGAEVLDVPADAAAGVLPEPVDDLREVDRVAGCASVVVAVRVERGPVGVDPAIQVEGQGEEGGGPVPAAVDPAKGALVHRPARQVRRILPTSGRAAPDLGCRVERDELAAHAEGP